MLELDKNNMSLNNDAAGKAADFTEETIEALRDFGKVLQRIHNRLVSEGITIEVDSHYAKRKGEK